ncbi:hypothetical protein RRG08_040785 [Elysia crispata]|uniref:Uncharacterized protein n=1 Tax=Elysia crispata TaxID=231223 RepID=A0AAE1BDG1_9GAST|nr:hypothetical protein RRG08_040785 [Elysia crispata]
MIVFVSLDSGASLPRAMRRKAGSYLKVSEFFAEVKAMMKRALASVSERQHATLDCDWKTPVLCVSPSKHSDRVVCCAR